MPFRLLFACIKLVAYSKLVFLNMSKFICLLINRLVWSQTKRVATHDIWFPNLSFSKVPIRLAIFKILNLILVAYDPLQTCNKLQTNEIVPPGVTIPPN